MFKKREPVWKYREESKQLPPNRLPLLPGTTPLEPSKLINLLNHKAIRVCVWKQGIGNINRIQNKLAVYLDVCSSRIHFTTRKSGIRWSQLVFYIVIQHWSVSNSTALNDISACPLGCNRHHFQAFSPCSTAWAHPGSWNYTNNEIQVHKCTSKRTSYLLKDSKKWKSSAKLLFP